MVPVPESLMSPDCPPPAGVTPGHPKGATASITLNNRSLTKPNKESKLTSPKINRTVATKQQQRQEKSPVLNVRKNNSINAALKANQNHSGHHHSDIMTTSTPKHQKNVQQTHRASPPPSQPQPVQHTPPPMDDSNLVSSDDDSDNINVDKLKTIHSRAAQRYYSNLCICLYALCTISNEHKQVN